jgi:FHS family glucose/mannose:H+ symporter-like MFS transporter
MKSSITDNDTFLSYLKELPNYMTIFIVTILSATASPMLIEMSRTTGYSTGDLSLIFTFFTIGIVTGQLTSVFFNRKFRKITIILFGYALIIIMLILMANTTNLYLFYTLYLLTGYTSGVIWIQATKDILENKIKNKDRLTSIFLIFNSLGYIAAPFISSNLIKNGISWKYSYYVLALLPVLALVLYMILKNGWKEKILTTDEESISFRKIFHNHRLNVIFIFGCLLLFFYCISEGAMVVWSPTYLRSEKLFDIQTASFAISVFWIAVLAGRIIISFLAGKIKTNYIILILSLLAVIALSIFIPLKTTYGTLIAIGFAGLGCSAIVPLEISSASTIYEKGRGVLASLLFAIASMGTSAAPLITRSLSRLNLTLSMIVAPLAMGVTVLIVFGKIIYENKSKEK